MNDLEVFHATLEHRRPDRILYRADFTPDLKRRVGEHVGGGDIAAHYGFFRPVHLSIPRPGGLAPLDYSRYWHGRTLPEGTTFDGFGVAMVPSGFYHFWGYVSPLREATSLADIENYPLDDLSGWDFSGLAGQVRAAHAAGKVTVGWVGHMYETAWQIRGYEEFLMDLVERPAWAGCLLERLFEQNLARARAFASARFSSNDCEITPRIQFKSAPAQNDFPAPDRITTLIAGSFSISVNAADNSEITVELNAL